MTSTRPKGYTRADYAALTHLTVRAAAERLGVRPVTVRQAAARHGLTFAPGRGQRGKAEARREVYAALTHLCEAEVARVLRVDLPAVRLAARRYGLRFAPAPDPEPVPEPPPAPEPAPVVPEPPRPMVMADAPGWNPDRDARLVQTKGRHAAIADLAADWSMPISRVLARWHIVRPR